MSCYPHTLKIVLPPPSCQDSGAYTASNANLTGEGVFFQKSGNEFQFYGISNTDGYITVELDATNKAVVLGIDPDLISGSIPDSTTTVKGKTAYSTDAEAQAMTATTKALTPSNLAALAASTVFVGMTRFATNVETQSGSSSAIAVTPAGLKSVTDALGVTRVAANSVARGSATPAFAGQLLFQLDTEVLYKGDSTSAGDWSLAAVPRTGVVDTPNLTLVSNNGELELADTETRTTMFFSFETGLQVDQVFNITTTTEIQRDGTAIPANSILLTSGTAGQISYIGANQFVGQYATEPYTVSGYTPTRSLDTGTAGLPEALNVLATLIADLAATKKPQF